jgi:ABC-2 type transport system permease protein
VLWDFFSRVMHGVATAFFEDVWSRNFLNLFASPLTIFEYLAGLVITSTATSWVALVMMLMLAGIAFGFSALVFGLMLFPFLAILFLFGVSLGIVGVAAVLRWGPAAEWFVWPIPALISPFAGVFYPLSTLPSWMQAVSYFLPPAYVFEGVRAIIIGRNVLAGPLLVGLALAALYIVLAGCLFQRVYRRALRTGLIPRYSAETLV